MKFITRVFLITLMCGLFFSNIQADTAFYYVYDESSTLNEQFESYNQAKAFYDENIDNYDNLVLSDGENVLRMEYGVVSFKSDGCPLTQYTSVSRNDKDMINGCYGNDGLYLYSDGEDVLFYLSGDVGKTAIDEITLVPFRNDKVSSYYVKDAYLYHNIVANMDGYYAYSLMLDKDVEGLKDNHRYYSYDGHYFYDDFFVMSDDFRNDVRENAVNYDDPYYNYYQYLTYRTRSNYSADDFDFYLKDVMKFTGMLNSYSDHNGDGSNDVVNRSQLYDVSKSLKANETVNGTNALLVLASAINDSSFGKSRESYYYNSIFQTASYNRDFQRETGYFSTVYDSINNYSHFTMNKYFANRRSSFYAGTYPGDKLGGLTVNYNSDPYYGERVASIAFDIDEKLGFKDRNSYSLVFANDSNDLYKDEEFDDYLYTLNNKQAVYPLLSVDEDAYKIQIDQASKDCTYNYAENVAYINEEEVIFTLNIENAQDYEYKNVYVDFDGGYFEDYSHLDLKVIDENEIENIVPEKNGYVFDLYSKTYDTENEVWNYKAEYKKVTEVSFYDNFDKTLDIGTYLDFKDSSIMVSYENGDGQILPLTSNILGYYENSYEHSEDIYVDFAGIRQYSTIEVRDLSSDLYERLYTNLDNGVYSEVKKIVMNNDVYLEWNDIRKADGNIAEKNSRNYVMSMYDENADISVSGLDLSIPDRKTFSLIQDIYYLDFAKINEENASAMANVASLYGFEPAKGMDISYRFNYETIKMQGPVIIQVKIDDKDINDIYSVYHLDEKGQVIKCKTIHSRDYVIFEADEEGSYLILHKDSFNTFDFENGVENLKYSDTGVDEHKVNIEFLLVMVIVLANFIGIAIYYIFNSRKDEKWRDYKKLLQTQASVPEEKQKN